MTYSIFIHRSAQNSLKHIATPDQHRIIQAIRELAHDPRPTGARKLGGREAWRIRVGNYRVIYEIHDDRLIIIVIAVGHRREIYR